jgi:hypothetical protein
MNQARSLLAVCLASFMLSGCAVQSGTTTTPTVLSAKLIYLAQDTPNGTSQPAQILLYPTGAPPSPTPLNIITLPGITTIGPIAADSSGNLYVATTTDVREYAAGATGAATPIRLIPDNATTTIAPATGLSINVVGLAVDSTGSIYVSESQGGVAIFSSAANGSVAPTRYIPSGSLTTLIQPSSIGVDGFGNLYVSNSLGDVPLPSGGSPYISVLVFGSTANGNVAPSRVLNQSCPGLGVDATGNVYCLQLAGQPAINEFAAGTSSSAAPIHSLSLSQDAVTGFTVGLAGDLYVGVDGSLVNNVRSATPSVGSYAPLASGSTSPVASFEPGSYIGAGLAGMAVF